MPLSPLEMLKVDDWDQCIDVNIKGVWYGIAAALPHMKEQKPGLMLIQGRLINRGAPALVLCGFAHPTGEHLLLDHWPGSVIVGHQPALFRAAREQRDKYQTG